MHNLLLLAARGSAHVIVVEKPGVQFLDNPRQPGSAEGASNDFLQEHTLPRWAEANRAALLAARTLSNVNLSKTLVIGHSEGGLVAARVSRLVPEVTHVASLAGGGPVQLFSLAEQRALPQPTDQAGDADRRRQSLYDEWSHVKQDPDSTTKMWLGHPHRRWTSFMSTSVVTELKNTKAEIFLAQGGKDQAVPPTGHDVLVAELKADSKHVTEVRIADADHGFQKTTEPAGSPEGLKAVLHQALDWFVSGKALQIK
jgi:pimeloyl-ACP methyl ester carboxylesterase